MTPNEVHQRQFEHLWRVLWSADFNRDVRKDHKLLDGGVSTSFEVCLCRRPSYSAKCGPALACTAPILCKMSCDRIAPPAGPGAVGIMKQRTGLFCCWGCSALRDECLPALSSDPLRGGKQMQPIYLKPRRSCRSRPGAPDPSREQRRERNK